MFIIIAINTVLSMYTYSDCKTILYYRELLNYVDSIEDYQTLINDAPKAILIYKEILNDPTTRPLHLRRLYGVISVSSVVYFKLFEFILAIMN